MSELIKNRQHRIDIMKNLVRQLHEGKAPEKVRKQLETMLDNADYSDVFMMEIQLIEEGISAESIQELCDTHTNVLKKQLDLQETPDTTPGHPVHTFIQENKSLTQKTNLIKLLVGEIEQMDGQSNGISKMRGIQSHLNDLMDVDKHYRRKENLLFPFFEKKNMPGPPTVMWGKDDEIRELLKTTIAGLQEIDSIDADEAKAFNMLAVLPAIEAVEEMIFKEEKILFPTALDLLEEHEWYDIYLQSDEIGYCLYLPEFKWTPSADVRIEKLQPSEVNGRIQLPTGSFSAEELIAVFKTLPIDITFIDKNDNVKYFNESPDRIFERTRIILGRKVQYCHPPTSVHIVNQILDDFKSGKQDRARFWINLGGKLIYIVYYAVRNEKGEYTGTLEVTQDLTEIKTIEGERRLLTYDER